MKQSTANTGFPTVVGDSIRYKTELGEISLLRPYGRIQQYEIYCIEGDLFEGIELFDTLEEAEARINNLLKEDEMWIKTTNKEPQVGQQVITYHQLNRIDILTFDGESF
ncbi:MAG: hypothetical protein KJ648_07690, partial [Candidatus Omnitrophica bacterium]|nr:hypothetical protein [Candidatus Omnitrophota bacterium]